MKNYAFLIFIFNFLFIGSLIAGEGGDFYNEKMKKLNKLRSELFKNYDNKQKVKEITDKTRKVIKNLIDIKNMSKYVLGKFYNNSKYVSAKQRMEFLSLFNRLITDKVVNANMPEKKSLIKKIDLEVKKDSSIADTIFKRKAFVVYTNLKKDGIMYDVNFYFGKDDNKMTLYDIRIDDNSTLLDYKNYFARLIRKKGMEYLLNKIRLKINQVEKVR